MYGDLLQILAVVRFNIWFCVLISTCLYVNVPVWV